jgi:putative hemolysin
MEVSSLWFNTQFTIARAPHVLRLKSLEGKILKPTIQVDFENEFYHVKTVNHPEELAQVLSLRFEVFFREFSTQKVTFSLFPYDVDMHDFLCDHLIVKDKAEDKVVACYRLLASNTDKKIKRFYSEGEFEISSILEASGNKLELGRACVHKDYRTGSVISLLWKGLLDYAKQADTRYMFGCSSINRKDFQNLPLIMDYLEKNDSFINEFQVGVQSKYKMKFKIDGQPSEEKSSGKAMGSLMHMYIMAGAKMGRTLAYDAEMDCLDMFTLMDMKNLPPSFKRRFA